MYRVNDTPGLSDAAGLMQRLHYDSLKLIFFCALSFVRMIAIACVLENVREPLWASCPSQAKLVYPRV